MRSARHSKGFTLIELMVTVAIIGIAMALSIPSVMQVMRDRRLQQQAVNFLSLFREARTRAMMRGVAQMVRVDVGASPPTQEMYDPNPIAALNQSTSSCISSVFTPAGLVLRNQSLVNEGTGSIGRETTIANTSPGVSVIEFCFTPSGRMYFRTSPTATFTEDTSGRSGPAIAGGFMYTFTSIQSPDTVARRVFVPLGSPARLAP